MIELLAFGSLELRDPVRGPIPRVLAQPKRAALLIYLALARPRGFHRRDELLSVFWPDNETGSARNALSRALSFLRQELPESIIVVRGMEEVGLDSEKVRCDVRNFEAAAARGDHETAVGLYRGPFLNAFHLAGSPLFERWVDSERERLREQASRSAWAHARAHIEAGRFVEAERMGQKALSWSPTDESAVREFIAALAPGDRAAALRFYEKFAVMLSEELDVAPAPETAAVAEAVRARTVESVPGSGSTSPAHRPEQPGVLAPRSPSVDGAAGNPLPGSSAPGQNGDDRTGNAPATRGRHRRIWGVAAVITALGLALLGGFRWREVGRTGAPGTLIGEGAASLYDAILVADFRFPSDQGLGVTAAEWLRTEIDQSDIVRPVGSAAMGSALRRMGRDPTAPVDAETAREMALRDGYPLVVVGALDEVGGRYLFNIQLESAEGEVLGWFNAAASGTEFVDALDRIGGEIRARMGESRRSIRRSPPLEQVTTGSLDALRLYTEAVRLRDWQGRQAEAIPLLEGAIALDPGFAAAYRKLGVTLDNLSLSPARQDELRRLAYEHRDRLTEFERLGVEAANAVLVSPDDGDECSFAEPGFRLYEAYIRRHPEDPRPLHNYGFYAGLTERMETAIAAYRRAIELGRGSSITYNNLIYAYLRSGDRDGVNSTLDAWARRIPDSPLRGGVLGDVFYAMGEYDRADSVWGAWQGNLPPDPQVRRGEMDLLRGRLREARGHFQEAAELLGPSAGEGAVSTLSALTLFRLFVSDGSEPVEALLSPDMPDLGTARQLLWIDAGLLFAASGQVDRAREALDTLEALGAGDYWLVRGLVSAATAAAEGEPGSVEALRRARSGCVFANRDYRFYPLMRGRAWEAMGRPEEAAAAYEEWLQAPPHLRWDALLLFDTLERLGGLREELGQAREAARYYRRGADLWRNADPELQMRAMNLRERALELESRGS